MMNPRDNKGTSLMDLIISIAIIALLFGGVYLVYFSIVTAVANIGIRNAASVALQTETETVRNLPYDSVGTVGGIPTGVIQPVQTMTVGKYTFSVQTTIRNIDDPFDGTLGGTPNDTAPADYKLVSITASCPLCGTNFIPVTITTTVAPKNLESATQDGSIFISTLDANGVGVPGATVSVSNNTVTPSINLTDTTNASGVLELVGVPTSTQGYFISVTKNGYSSDQTYPAGGAGNPNPVTPNVTVAAQTVTSLTLQIDRASSMTVTTSDNRCQAVPNESFIMAGTKIIGTNPDVLKFSITTSTKADGTLSLPSIEWDTYTLGLRDPSRDLAGTMPFEPLIINPSSTIAFQFVSEPAADPALLVTVADAATGAGIPDAQVTISKGTPITQLTDHAIAGETDWSGNNFAAQSGGLDPDSAPGSVTLLANASGTYIAGPSEWIESKTIDLGGSNAVLHTIAWNPTVQPPSTGADSLKFQMAANNDNATWNYIGPDGGPTTYFMNSGTQLPASLNGNRYVRYKAFLTTQDASTTPELDDFSLDFAADCVPPAQTLFTNLPQGTYSIDVTAAGYAEGTSTVSVGTGFQSQKISLTHL